MSTSDADVEVEVDASLWSSERRVFLKESGVALLSCSSAPRGRLRGFDASRSIITKSIFVERKGGSAREASLRLILRMAIVEVWASRFWISIAFLVRQGLDKIEWGWKSKGEEEKRKEEKRN